MAEQRFHTPDLRRLEITIPAGAVRVETVDGDESLVVVEGDDRLVENTRVELRGGVLSVEFEGKRNLFGITIAIGDFSFGGSRLEVRAQVPHGTDVELATAAADMTVRGRIGALDAKTASGDVHVIGEIERDAVLKTVSGDVTLAEVGGELRVQSVSGDLTTAGIGGSVVSKSVSGDVRIGSVREGHASLQSVSGDIEVGVAPGTSIDVDAGSVSGELSSEVPLAGAPEGDGGPTVVVRGKTVSGDFRVFRAA
jgi:putative adhesin